MTKEEIINRLIDLQIYNENDREELENSDIESLKDDLLVALEKEIEDKSNLYQGTISRYMKRIEKLEKENKVLAQNLEDTEICEKTLKDKIAELKHDVEIWKKANENNGYKAFKLAEENAELKEQIEKMKCCGNCSHFKTDNNNLYPVLRCEFEYPNRCMNYDKWEIKEK